MSNGGRYNLAPAGPLRGERAEALDRAVAEIASHGPASLTLDLRDVTSLDAAALGTLLRTDAWSRRVGFDLVVLRPRGDAELRLRVSGVDRHLPLLEAGRGEDG